MSAFLIAAAMLQVLPAAAFAEVIAHDQLVVTPEEVLLKAETRGVYFAKGGQVVEFFSNGKALGSVLSGGDGIAYKPHVFSTSGLFKISAKSNNEQGSGRVLSLKKGSSVICIDIEGGLLATPFSKKPIAVSRDAIRRIIKKYPVVYIHTGMLGIGATKAWLAKNSFPESVVIAWDMGEVFREMARKGLRIKAVIGSQAFVSSGREFAAKAFSFDDTAEAEYVRDWQEIESKLVRNR